jgi:hypothetical protein
MVSICNREPDTTNHGYIKFVHFPFLVSWFHDIKCIQEKRSPFLDIEEHVPGRGAEGAILTREESDSASKTGSLLHGHAEITTE